MDSFLSKSGRTITLRPPQEGDETILFNYITALSNEDQYVLVNPQEPVSFEEEKRYLVDILHKVKTRYQVYYLAFYQDELIGSSQITKLGRRKMHSGTFGISLKKEFRSDGIGFQLSQHVLNQAKEQLGLSLVTLELFSENQVAYHLYHKLGFIEYGRLPQGLQYRQGYCDAILMFRQL